MIKKIIAAAAASCMILNFSACSSADLSVSSDVSSVSSISVSSLKSDEIVTDNDSKAENDTSKLTEIDVVLDWYPNAIHTFLYYAVDKGYFAEEGLKVNLISPADSVDAITFVASGKAQIGLTYPVEIVDSYENNLPVKALASVCVNNISCFCSLASNTEITEDMTSLKGKKVGYSGPAAEEAFSRSVARYAGLEDDEYELINVGFDLVTSLTTGSVDVVNGIFINDEVPTMELEGYEVNVYRYSDYGIPEMFGLLMAVNTDSYDADPELYKGFLNACEKGYEDMCADEDAAVELIMSEMNSDDNPLDEEQQRMSYEILMENMSSQDQPFLSMSTDQWQTIIDWMYESGLIETQINAEDVMV